jgi:hypothetical protein
MTPIKCLNFYQIFSFPVYNLNASEFCQILISGLLFMLQQSWRIDLFMINSEDEIHFPCHNSSTETSNEGKLDNVHLILLGMTGTLNIH